MGCGNSRTLESDIHKSRSNRNLKPNSKGSTANIPSSKNEELKIAHTNSPRKSSKLPTKKLQEAIISKIKQGLSPKKEKDNLYNEIIFSVQKVCFDNGGESPCNSTETQYLSIASGKIGTNSLLNLYTNLDKDMEYNKSFNINFNKGSFYSEVDRNTKTQPNMLLFNINNNDIAYNNYPNLIHSYNFHNNNEEMLTFHQLLTQLSLLNNNILDEMKDVIRHNIEKYDNYRGCILYYDSTGPYSHFMNELLNENDLLKNSLVNIYTNEVDINTKPQLAQCYNHISTMTSLTELASLVNVVDLSACEGKHEKISQAYCDLYSVINYSKSGSFSLSHMIRNSITFPRLKFNSLFYIEQKDKDSVISDFDNLFLNNDYCFRKGINIHNNGRLYNIYNVHRGNWKEMTQLMILSTRGEDYDFSKSISGMNNPFVNSTNKFNKSYSLANKEGISLTTLLSHKTSFVNESNDWLSLSKQIISKKLHSELYDENYLNECNENCNDLVWEYEN